MLVGSLSFIPHHITPAFVGKVPSLPKVIENGSNATSLTALRICGKLYFSPIKASVMCRLPYEQKFPSMPFAFNAFCTPTREFLNASLNRIAIKMRDKCIK